MTVQATLIRAAEPRGVEPRSLPPKVAVQAREGNDVTPEDAAALREQLEETGATVKKLTDRVQVAIRESEGNTVELYGVAGNPGLSQQVAALHESKKSTRRELRITRRQVEQASKQINARVDALEVALGKGFDSMNNRIVELGVNLAKRTTFERVLVALCLVLVSAACFALIGMAGLWAHDRMSALQPPPPASEKLR